MAWHDPISSRTRSFWYGITLPLQALRLIVQHPVLIFLSVLPIAIAVSLYVYLISHLQDQARLMLNNYLISWGLNPEGWAAWVVFFAAKLLLLVVTALTFSIVASVVASPFNDFLAEKAESKCEYPLSAAPQSTLLDKLRFLGIDFFKSIFATGASVIALLVSWVPGLNIVTFIAAFLLVTFQYISYPQTRRGQGVGSGLLFLWQYPFACIGFGMSLSFFFAIPLLSCIVIAPAVVGGTLLVSRSKAGDPYPPLR